MKKFSILILLLVILWACKKKEDHVEQNLTENKSEVAEENVIFKPVFNQKEALQKVNPQDIENIVGAHDNDTIYVTNFFATWCPPCMKEIPLFKDKMESTKGQAVKFTFVDVDEMSDWDTEVKNFAETNGLQNNMVLLDGTSLTNDFYTNNFKTWDGGSIPFTIIRKGKQSYEHVGLMTPEMMEEIWSKF